MSAPKLTELLANAPEEEEIEGYLVEEGGKIKAHSKDFKAGGTGGALEPIEFSCDWEELMNEGTVEAVLTSGEIDSMRLFNDFAYYMDVYFNVSLKMFDEYEDCDIVCFYPYPGLEQHYFYNYNQYTIAHVDDHSVGYCPPYIDSNEGIVSFCFGFSAITYDYPTYLYDSRGGSLPRYDYQGYLVYAAHDNKWYITVNKYGGGDI